MRCITISAAVLLFLLVTPALAGIVTTNQVTFIPVYEGDVVHSNTSWENWTSMITNATGTTVTATSAARIIGVNSGTQAQNRSYNYSGVWRMIYSFDLRSIPMNATVTGGYLSLNVSENSTKLGQTQIVFTRVVGHRTVGSGLRENFTDSTALSTAGYSQWLNVNSAGESNMTEALEINKTPLSNRWNFTLTDHGIDEINNNTFRNTRQYGNYTVFMGRLGWDASNYTISAGNVPEWHYNMVTRVTIRSFREYNRNSTPMLILNYTMVESPLTTLPPVADFSVNLTPGPSGMLAQFFSQANNTIEGTTKYSWNFTNGGTKVDSTDENPTFTYSVAGTYSVNFTVYTSGTIRDSLVKNNYIIIYTPTATPTPCPSVTPCPGTCDDYTTSLLHYEGADHSTDVIDENTANSWLLWGVGEITTDQQKFGASSYGTADASSHARLTPPSATTFNLGKSNWTWDTWIRYDDNALATPHGIFTMGAYGAGSKAVILDLENIAGVSSYNLNIFNGIVTTGSYQYEPIAGEYNINRWYHLEVSRNHTYINLSIDGEQKEWDHVSGGITATTDLGNPGNMTLGYDSHGDHYLDGWLDETRMSVGIQRHGSDFAVPTEAYEWNPCTSGGGTCTYGYNSSSYFHDVNYIPVELEYIFILIGFVSLIASRIIKKYGMLTAIIAPLAFGIAAWYANYMEKSQISGVNLGGNPFMIHTEVIIPSAPLSVLMVVCFLISLVNILLIFFLSQPERKEEMEY